ncbi:hypothetical protein jhhlp_006513 [Lomentospora prolificans]|uniref:Uncharacterized protein n=1 Tax=Lomentospora prolificans TaxID=41688 RepID=A0A2N3N645_9PEZI|nr:hypothetical protein jhhlp_006513 [Lomentospora prolificans]
MGFLSDGINRESWQGIGVVNCFETCLRQLYSETPRDRTKYLLIGITIIRIRKPIKLILRLAERRLPTPLRRLFFSFLLLLFLLPTAIPPLARRRTVLPTVLFLLFLNLVRARNIPPVALRRTAHVLDEAQGTAIAEDERERVPRGGLEEENVVIVVVARLIDGGVLVGTVFVIIARHVDFVAADFCVGRLFFGRRGTPGFGFFALGLAFGLAVGFSVGLGSFFFFFFLVFLFLFILIRAPTRSGSKANVKLNARLAFVTCSQRIVQAAPEAPREEIVALNGALGCELKPLPELAAREENIEELGDGGLLLRSPQLVGARRLLVEKPVLVRRPGNLPRRLLLDDRAVPGQLLLLLALDVLAQARGKLGRKDIREGDARRLVKVLRDLVERVGGEIGGRNELEVGFVEVSRRAGLSAGALHRDRPRLGAIVLVRVALKLHQAAVLHLLLFGALDVAVLADLGDVEPAADGHADAAAVGLELRPGLGVVDLLDVVEALARLDGEEAELVPRGRDDLGDVRERRLGHDAVGALRLLDGEQTQSAAPLGLPRLIGIRKIENVADFAAPNHVVVAEEEAAGRVHVDGHVSLPPAEGSAPRNMGDVVAEGLGVDCVAEGEEGRQLGQGFVVEAVEVGEVAGLVDLVDVGLLGGEGDVVADLGAHVAQQGVVDELVDDGVLVGRRGGVLGGVVVEDGLVEEALAEPLLCLFGAEA